MCHNTQHIDYRHLELMTKIFISYRRSDTKKVAARISDHLVRTFGKKNVFLDVSHDSIPGGSNWLNVLEEEVAASDVMLVIIGNDWIRIINERQNDERDFVRREIEQALRLGDKLHIIPVLVDDASAPDEHELPESIRKLSSFQVHPMPDDPYFDDGIRKLVREIRRNSPRFTPLFALTLVALAVFVFLGFALFAPDSVRQNPIAALFANTTEETVSSLTDTLETPTSTAVPTHTETPLPTDTSTATVTPTNTATDTVTPSATNTATDTPTITASASNTPTDTATVTATASNTPTNTATITPSPTSTATSSSTPTATSTPTITPFPTAIVNDLWMPVVQSFADMHNMDMVLVPPGCFMMGSVSNDADPDEAPVHEQCIDAPFWIGRYEVTNDEYGSDGAFSAPRRPRDSIEWVEANAFCLSIHGRLPTEIEWEFAARGPDSLIYPWGDDFEDDHVVYYRYPNTENIRPGTELVGSAPGGVSWVGAYDMVGSLWEWTSSFYHPYPYDPEIAEEDETEHHTARGGDWHNTERRVRTANRLEGIAPSGRNGMGFRCARDYNPEEDARLLNN